ncbi:MAG TPA: hypothetical protein VGI78_07175 [Acetobacteraceae bacterium]
MTNTEGPADTLSGSDRDWVDHILRSQWLLPDSQHPIRAEVIGHDEIGMGRHRTSIRDAIAARPSGTMNEALKLCLVHDGWKVVPLQVYRPLAYYAAFGNAEVFACLRIAIQSLLTFGRWTHDIAVLTSDADLAAVAAALSPLKLGERLHLITVPGADILDWCLARYRINAAAVFRTHQPLLYLDTDVFCDAPLDALCRDLARSTKIEAKAEGPLCEGEPEPHGHWYGWRLLTADALAVDRMDRGFSTGIVGFANIGVAADAFSAILRSAYGHAALTGDRRFFAGYDQPIANYVLRKLAVVSFALMEGIASFCRVQPGARPLPGPDRPRGLVHFNGVVGDATSKRGAMEHYLACLGAPSPG